MATLPGAALPEEYVSDVYEMPEQVTLWQDAWRRLLANRAALVSLIILAVIALVSIVGLWELTMASREVVERTLAPFQIFLGAAAIYFCICYAMALYGRYLERRSLVGH